MGGIQGQAWLLIYWSRSPRLKRVRPRQFFLQGSPPPAPSVTNRWRYLTGALVILAAIGIRGQA